jgi:hypothetical protein
MAVSVDVIAFGADHPFETSKDALEGLGILADLRGGQGEFLSRKR